MRFVIDRELEEVVEIVGLVNFGDLAKKAGLGRGKKSL